MAQPSWLWGEQASRLQSKRPGETSRRPNSWKPLLLVPRSFHDLDKTARIQAGAANEGAVDVWLAH